MAPWTAFCRHAEDWGLRNGDSRRNRRWIYTLLINIGSEGPKNGLGDGMSAKKLESERKEDIHEKKHESERIVWWRVLLQKKPKSSRNSHELLGF